jgi:nicotinate dehydrogenase subunit B
MNDTIPEQPVIEPERYEFFAGPVLRFETDRREFLKRLGGGIVVLLFLDAALAQESGGGRAGGGRGRQGPTDLAAWLRIGDDGTVTVFTGKVELGQNTRTSLTQAVADELRAPMASVRLVMADTDLTPYDAGTFGSQSTPTMAPQLRRAAAAAREALLDLAADRLHADRNSLTVADGKISRAGTNDSATFAELARGHQLVKSVRGQAVTAPAQWTVAGTAVPKVDGRDFVTGRHKYASDIKLPGMLHGKVARPAALGATLDTADTKAAEGMEGITVVRDGDFVGVAAANPELAARGLGAIGMEWNMKPQSSGAELYDYLRKNAATSESRGGYQAGSMDDGLAAAEHKLQQTYTVAYIAHAPLETRAAVADWNAGKLTVWTGTSRPFGVRSELADAFGLPEEKVRVIVPDTGAGYGGKHTGRAAIEAARLAKATGKPVKVAWSRREEFAWAYLRPAGVIDISSGVTKDGALTAWECHNYNSGSAGIRTPYEAPNQKIEFHSTDSPLPQGSYRALAATGNHFARETHMDELARTLQMDPLEFRFKNLTNDRLRAVFHAAADAFGWGAAKPAADHGFGIAGGTEKGSYLATCAEVAVDRKTGEVRVVRAVSAFDCGAVVNPEHLKNQVEGALVMGLGGALFEAIEFHDGQIDNGRFSEYRVPRFSDVPRIEVVLLDRKDTASAGAGETPIIGIAPAIGNAIFDATGKRLRSMPLAPQGINLGA